MIFDKAGSRRGQLFLSSILANPDERFPEPSDAPVLKYFKKVLCRLASEALVDGVLVDELALDCSAPV